MSGLSFLVVCTLLGAGHGAGEMPTPVGIARQDITPAHPIRLNGFGFRREESAGVRRPIDVKAIAIGTVQSGGPYVLIAAETLGIPDRVTVQVAEALAKHGVARERLAITATHTHTGPMINHVSPTLFGEPIPPDHQAHIDQYSQQFLEALIQVAEAALDNRQPSFLKWGKGEVTFAQNRRQDGGPVDHQLPVLAVYGEQRQLRAVWATYACHCVTLSDNRISGDWAGYAAEAVERLNPGCTAMISIGCGADANPSSGVAGDRADLAEAQGAEIATEIVRLLKSELAQVPAPTAAHYERITLPLAPHPTRDVWEQRAEQADATGHHARTQLSRLDRGEELLTEVTYPIQSWQFGEQLAMVFLPGEVVVDYALRLNSELDHNRLWIHAYANHCPGYIPSERVLGEGGYEAGGAMIYYDLPGPYAPGLEDRVVQSVTDQLRHLRIQTPSESDQGRQQLPQHSPQSSLDAIEAAHGLQVELVAAEPLVESPVAIAFALDGSLWVAEMFDYPAGVDGNFGPGGRVKRLEDRNRDGQYDHATVFLQNIPFPTGVTVWRDGLLVCAAPDILFARDTTGDGVADDVQTLFHGFGTDNYQARVNSLEYGLDGWVYGSCGLFGGTITTPQHRNIELGNRDFRIDPDHGILEPASGRTQQGRVRNDLGDWFGCDNGQFIYHYPLPDHYLRRNPYSNASSGAHAILRGDDALRVYPLATPTLYQLSGPAGVATAACGLGIYRNDYLGESFAGNAFTCEPVNNLVTRRCLVERGTSWDAVRAGDETGIDIVRSRDTWFRPVQARTGPDGALWIVDMHRQVIEHPRWIPAGTLEQLEVRAGANTGRIYRVVRRDQSPDAMLVSSTGDPQDLVSQLASRNGTRRDLATMALTWMSDEQRPPLVQRLREVVDAPSSDLHLLHALVVLDAWHQLRDTDILTALRHPSSWMRVHALRWSEGRAVEGGPMEDAMLQLASDPHPRVRLQAAFSLGAIDSSRAADAIARLLAGSLPDDHIHAAAISSLRPANLTAVIGAVMQHVADHPNEHDTEHDTEHDSPLLDGELCRHAAAFGMPAAASPILDARKAFGAGSCDGLRLLIDVFEGHRMAGLDADRLATQLPELSRAMERSRDVVADDKQSESLRLIAVRLLGTSTILPEQNADVLLQMLTPRTTPPLQLAVIDALGRIGDAKIADHLVRSWPTFGPTLRARIVDAMISREGWARKLAEAIANETIGQGECSLQQQTALLEHSDSSVRQVAAACFTAQPKPAPNVSDLREHLDAMEQSKHADSSAGRQIFAQKCATCHRLGDQGEPLGPDIANYANKPADAFALSITRPNAAVDPRYVSYTAITSDGRIATGMIVDESSNAVVIQGADAKRVTLNRREIEELQSTGRSLMPDGFANELSPAAMRDLWAFVKQSAATQGQLSDQIVE